MHFKLFRWIIYILKDDIVFGDPFPIYNSSCYLIGRERRVVDLPTDHPSCSGQHAVLQHRNFKFENFETDIIQVVRPYIMDLNSMNGTFLNGQKIEPEKYYEIFEKDVIKFGQSSREYLLLHSNSN